MKKYLRTQYETFFQIILARNIVTCFKSNLNKGPSFEPITEFQLFLLDW